ncbi:LysM peptidoglycan-binding domain-containing protein [Arthrobacter sp. RT-1]|jgi:nucleoid-associated protein YgaU|uniref:Gmad2 immunoglobulin-like domain-containing protein n=1 Tax=Arthrobacter sp. RT-1 TaxID=2292263 RepID=UPI000E1ED514|nr:Gmad2 immunoglobulin-like domain-containing protein [Arthrobacter sp. RT-1]RDV10455.1 LysM peptidoglycan-binding domain-containing protein [Arthrobacter sp. RT-1]
MAPLLIEVRQPTPNDVIGREFTIAGFGTGFEATVLWRLLDRNGQGVAQGNIQGAGSMGVIKDFGHQVSIGGYTARAAPMTLQVFGDDASGIHPPGTDLNLVPVTLFTALEGFKLYEVVAGDNLSKIAREQGQNTTVEDVIQANRDRIDNPDLIFPGQIFRIPLLA